MTSDLEKFKQGAKSRRELAWQLLKQTRNPAYVAMRYGFDIETMADALAKIPEEKPLNQRLAELHRAHTGATYGANRRRASVEPGQQTTPGREPGADDDKE